MALGSSAPAQGLISADSKGELDIVVPAKGKRFTPTNTVGATSFVPGDVLAQKIKPLASELGITVSGGSRLLMI